MRRELDLNTRIRRSDIYRQITRLVINRQYATPEEAPELTAKIAALRKKLDGLRGG